MDQNTYIVKIASFIVSIAICIVGIFACVYTLPSIIAENSAIDDAKAGVIVDKEIVNAHNSIFYASDIQYQITIEAEYEYKGETRSTTKSISVDKDTYLAAEIGMWFDIQSLVVSTIPD